MANFETTASGGTVQGVGFRPAYGGSPKRRASSERCSTTRRCADQRGGRSRSLSRFIMSAARGAPPLVRRSNRFFTLRSIIQRDFQFDGFRITERVLGESRTRVDTDAALLQPQCTADEISNPWNAGKDYPFAKLSHCGPVLDRTQVPYDRRSTTMREVATVRGVVRAKYGDPPNGTAGSTPRRISVPAWRARVG